MKSASELSVSSAVGAGLDAGPRAGSTPQAQWVESALLIIDLVESVRLIQRDEERAIARWRHLVDRVQHEVLPLHAARLVKSLGDGLLITADTVDRVVAVAHGCQSLLHLVNDGEAAADVFHLRMGVHVARVVVDPLDVYGSGVNLCARMATLAQPGQLLASAEARDRLVPGLDGDVVDLGLCYLKHVDGARRVFRLAAQQPDSAQPLPPAESLKPRVGVMPLACLPAQRALADALTDHVVAAMARSAHWVVTSRLSTAALRGRVLDPARAGSLLSTEYLLSGELTLATGGVDVQVRLHEARSGEVLWHGRFAPQTDSVLAGDDPFVPDLVAQVSTAILDRQVQVAHAAAVPNLADYTLLLDALPRMYACEPQDALRAGPMLEQLTDRHPRSAEAKGWLAKWHFMRLAQATTPDRDDTVQRARDLLARALDAEPTHAFALALDGHLHAYVDGDMPKAERQLRRAVDHGPNEALASLFLSQALRNQGRGAEAVTAVERASFLSPLDPLRYYFDLFAASAYSAAGDHERALLLARRSLQANALHLSTWVQLMIEQVHVGHLEDARNSARKYLAMRPAASVDRFLDRHPARGTALAASEAAALLAAGLPH